MKGKYRTMSTLTDAEFAVHWYRTEGMCFGAFRSDTTCFYCRHYDTMCSIVNDPVKLRYKKGMKYVKKHYAELLEQLLMED